jgi:hypothetical protein
VWGKAKKLFGPTVMTFVLDGKPFETTRLLVKPLLNDAPGKAFALVQGRVENDPDPEYAETYTYTSQFFVDTAGTGACT